MIIDNLPLSTTFHLNWEAMTGTVKMVITALMTADVAIGGDDPLPGFNIGDLARDVGNIVGDVVDVTENEPAD